MAIVYLGLGSNIGDTKKNLHAAITALEKLGSISKISSLYKTEPVGFIDQPWFLNEVIELITTLSPEELLKKTQEIENSLGRERIIHWGPRTLDIDILLYDNVVLETPTLTIPHSRMHERRFVLEPLAEIAKETMHSVLNKTMSELLVNLGEGKKVEKQ
ncbi:MAG: 2-amino-4-hydroxy-6-hydroxymethyldihydropteridine diphosphokinase [Candidatus Magasanikbacteria bacterium]|nr:2-amino-4-hydroxy-6-hydroxymethyldihydropteridine diphosphokinase [Candidatus Magasanikbacteria bacterium]